MPVLLALAFVVVPILEIYVILQVGQVIGAWWTVALLVTVSLLGAWMVRREGRRAWRELRDALGSGRLPSRELADAALLLVGATLLLTPGFLSDLVGLLLVLPPSRAVARSLLLRFLAARAVAAGGPVGLGAAWWLGSGRSGDRPPASRRGRTVRGDVVPGDVVRDEDHRP